MATGDRGLAAQLERRVPSLARKSMNFLRDVYQTTASPTPDRPHSSSGYGFQPSSGLSQHFHQGPQQTYPPLRPHSFSNATQPSYTANFTNSYAVQPMMHSPFLAPAAQPQSYFPQPHSTPVSPIGAPTDSFQWPPPPPPPPPPPGQFAPAPATYQTQSFQQDHPPPYSYGPPSPVSPMVEQTYWQPTQQQVSPNDQQPSPLPSPSQQPHRQSISSQSEHLARPYQWQSPDSFMAVQEAAQHDLRQHAQNNDNPPLPLRPGSSQPRPSSPSTYQPSEDDSYQARFDHSTPLQPPHRPSVSKPFPSNPTSYPGYSNQPHQAPYDQPASVEFPRFNSTGSIPHVAITPAAVELPAEPIPTKPSAQTQVPIPMMAELPG